MWRHYRTTTAPRNWTMTRTSCSARCPSTTNGVSYSTSSTRKASVKYPSTSSSRPSTAETSFKWSPPANWSSYKIAWSRYITIFRSLFHRPTQAWRTTRVQAPLMPSWRTIQGPVCWTSVCDRSSWTQRDDFARSIGCAFEVEHTDCLPTILLYLGRCR